MCNIAKHIFAKKIISASANETKGQIIIQSTEERKSIESKAIGKCFELVDQSIAYCAFCFVYYGNFNRTQKFNKMFRLNQIIIFNILE